MRLLTEAGTRWASELNGKPRIVALWAEWCTPCLHELPDLAGLHRRCGGRGFEVVSLLTASHERLDLAGARMRLARVGAGGLPVWVEAHGGDVLFGTLARQPDRHTELPCSLLVDAGGRVRGRAFGSAPADPAAMNALLKSFKLGPGGRISPQDMDRLAAARLGTVWSTPAADAFARALAEGALDRLPA